MTNSNPDEKEDLEIVSKECRDILMVTSCYIVPPSDARLRRLLHNPQLSHISRTQLLHLPHLSYIAKFQLLQEARSKYSKILENIAKCFCNGKSIQQAPINLPMLYYNRPESAIGRWAYDPVVDKHTIDHSLYYMNKHAHISHFLMSEMRDFSYVQQSTKEIFNRKGYDSALAFLQRLWDDCWIFDARICADLLWKYERGRTFSLEDPTSESCFTNMHHHNKRIKQDACFTRAAHLDKKSHRNPELLIKEATRLREYAEERLQKARSETKDVNNWLRQIFTILPIYYGVLDLFKESYFSTENSEIRKDLSREMRFVDERAADISSTVTSTPGAIFNSYARALIAYKKGSIDEAKRVLKFYCEGRVYYPRGFCEELEDQLGKSVPEIGIFFFNKLEKGFRQAFEIIAKVKGYPTHSDIVKLSS